MFKTEEKFAGKNFAVLLDFSASMYYNWEKEEVLRTNYDSRFTRAYLLFVLFAR